MKEKILVFLFDEIKREWVCIGEDYAEYTDVLCSLGAVCQHIK